MHVISGSGNTWKNRVQHPVHTKRQEHVTIVLYIVLQENMASSMGQDDEVSAPKMLFKKFFFWQQSLLSVSLWPTENG